MRTHAIEYTPLALSDLEKIHDWIERDSPASAASVVRRIVTAINRLATLPRSGRPAPERDRIVYELRQLSIRPYRALYTIQKGRVVILRVRHSAQDELSPDELQGTPPDHHA